MNKIEVRDVSPSTSIILAARNDSNMNLWKALSEIIDNAFDKKANQLRIHTSDNQLSVTDDGLGCDNPDVMVRFGDHFKLAKSGTTLGRYGIGLKEASIYLCNVMTIATNTGNSAFLCEVNWKRMIENNKWLFTRTVINAKALTKVGTSIEFKELLPGRGKITEIVKQKLSSIFTPGLLLGKQIIIDGMPLIPITTPELTNAIDLDGEWNGKEYSIQCGIIANKEYAKEYGWTICYGHRVIKSNVTDGSGDYSMARFYGRVTLYDGELDNQKWKLCKLKDSVEDLPEFLESLYPTIEPILKSAAKIAEHIELSAVTAEAENLLNKITQIRRKPTRNKPDKPTQEPPGKPTGKGTPHRPKPTDRIDDDGKPTDSDKKISKISILWDCNDPELIGFCTSNKRVHQVHLNSEHLFTKSVKRDSYTVMLLALALLTSHVVNNNDPQIQFPFAKPIQDTPRNQYNRHLSIFTEQITVENTKDKKG